MSFVRNIFCRKRRFLLFLTVAAVTLYLLLQEGHKHSCNVSPEVTKNLKIQTGEIINIFSSLNLNYFLCYGSIWGALYIHDILPWDTNVDFCITNNELMKIDESRFLKSFLDKGYDVIYNKKDGLYDVSWKSNKFGHVHIIIFEFDERTNFMRRVGWKNRLIPPDMCESIDCFPPNLIKPPLPKIAFSHLNVSVPHEEIEILKYFYPNDWWKELKPRDC